MAVVFIMRQLLTHDRILTTIAYPSNMLHNVNFMNSTSKGQVKGAQLWDKRTQDACEITYAKILIIYRHIDIKLMNALI